MAEIGDATGERWTPRFAVIQPVLRTTSEGGRITSTARHFLFGDAERQYVTAYLDVARYAAYVNILRLENPVSLKIGWT